MLQRILMGYLGLWCF